MRSATKAKKWKDKPYLAWLHTLPCLCCMTTVYKDFSVPIVRAIDKRAEALSGLQLSRTEAAHIGARGLSQKCPDREAIPLCREHHTEDRFSAHRLQKKFWEHYGLVKQDVIAALNRAFEEQANTDS